LNGVKKRVWVSGVCPFGGPPRVQCPIQQLIPQGVLNFQEVFSSSSKDLPTLTKPPLNLLRSYRESKTGRGEIGLGWPTGRSFSQSFLTLLPADRSIEYPDALR